MPIYSKPTIWILPLKGLMIFNLGFAKIKAGSVVMDILALFLVCKKVKTTKSSGINSIFLPLTEIISPG